MIDTTRPLNYFLELGSFAAGNGPGQGGNLPPTSTRTKEGSAALMSKLDLALSYQRVMMS